MTPKGKEANDLWLDSYFMLIFITISGARISIIFVIYSQESILWVPTQQFLINFVGECNSGKLSL